MLYQYALLPHTCFDEKLVTTTYYAIAIFLIHFYNKLLVRLNPFLSVKLARDYLVA